MMRMERMSIDKEERRQAPDAKGDSWCGIATLAGVGSCRGSHLCQFDHSEECGRDGFVGLFGTHWCRYNSDANLQI